MSGITETMLETEASRLLSTAHRESTSKVYQVAKKSYILFCNTFGYMPLPLTEHVMLKYVAYLALKELSSSTVKVYCSGIKTYSIIEGYGQPSNEYYRLKLAIRSLDINNKAGSKKLPITLDILQQLRGHMSDSYNDIMLWAAMTLAHFGLLRASEFTVNTVFDHSIHLCLSNVTFHVSESGISYINVLIKRSKTDKLNEGFHLYIGCSQTDVCAYCAIKTYHNVTHSKVNSQYSYDRPLFMFANGVCLSRQLLIRYTRVYLILAGIDPQLYTGHSYRIGGATSAAAAGMADWEIKVLGRWTSDTYQRYIRTPTSLLVGFANRMTKTSTNTLYNHHNPYVSNIFGNK